MPDTETPNKPLVHLSLCAGYGGIDLGLGLLGLHPERSVYVEVESWAAKNVEDKIEAGLLAAGPIYTDLKRFPFEGLAPPRDYDLILSGGFPCQPFSSAGKGGADDDPRHLFPFIKQGIVDCQPDLVVLENVEGILSAKLKSDRWADPAGTPVALHVLRELERVGYRATAVPVSASEVAAHDGNGRPRATPHQRNRVFFVGLPHRSGERGEAGLPGSQSWEERLAGILDDDCGEGPNVLAVARPGEPQHEWEAPRVV